MKAKRNSFPPSLFLLFIFALFYLVESQISLTTSYSTTLSSTQVVHQSYSTDPVYGIGFCELRRAKPEYIYCHICHQIAEPVSAYIEVGDVYKQGSPVYQFSVTLNPFFEEVLFLENYLDYPLTQQIEDFLNGKWYVTVNALDTQNTIRGQLQLNSNFYSYMASESTFPPAFGSPKRGITLSYYSVANPTRTASFDICHNVGDATQTLLGRGVPNLPGEYIYDFRSTSSLVFHELEYTINEQIELFEGYQFTQVNSQTNPAGAVRGQLVRLNEVDQISLTARMDGSQSGSTSNARGCALIYFDCNTNNLEYLIYHNVEQPTSAQLRIGPPGESGPILFLLNSAISPIYGSQFITEEEVYYLYSEQTYIQLNGENFDKSTGEIRGQLTSQFDFYAFLTGSQVVPPVTTANIGCGTVNLKQFNYVMDFEILHSIEGALSVDIAYASPGENGEMQNFGNLQYYDNSKTTFSPVIGEMVIDDDDGVAIIQGNAYFQVVSAAYPLGEIRGQIMRINPCNPNGNNSTQIVATKSFVAPPGSIIQLPINYGTGSTLQPNFWVLISLLCFVALLCYRK